MRNLIIIGARGLGRELYNLFKDCKEILPDIECKGYLDDKTDALDNFKGYPPILSSVEAYCPQPNDVFICALGDPKWKKYYTEIILKKKGNFINIIHPSAIISDYSSIGTGCVIGRFVSISCDVKIGNYTYIGAFSAIGHDSIVGDFCQLGVYTFLGGGAEIGNICTLHPRSYIFPHKKVKDESVVGAASVVMRNVPEKTTVYGNPAKKLD